MKYVSTRGSAPALDFAGVTLAGLASDGGLYVPEEWPQFSEDRIRSLRGASYVELAVEIMEPFVGDCLTVQELFDLCGSAYSRFSHDAVTPLVQLDHQNWLLELFHGPTLAFKDVALQLLGPLFEKFLAREHRSMTIVGATSGDTGSAAIDAVAGREHIRIYMLHPKGRVTEIQRRQMTTVRAANVHNIAIEGSFDDAQAIVKRLFNDRELTGHNLGAVNSINWARLMAQVVYYFYAALQLGAPDRKVAFSVPTGNFGDVFAGYVAARMGLPIDTLVVASNSNDILTRALRNADYSAGTVTPTITPSMDIQVSSNFERLLFDAGGRDAGALAEQMRGFEATRELRLSNLQMESTRKLFLAMKADEGDTYEAMRRAHSLSGQVVDPHTAVGLYCAREAISAEDIEEPPMVTLATAHPAKFPDAVERATGIRPSVPPRVGDLFAREERYVELPGTYEAVRDHILGNAS